MNPSNQQNKPSSIPLAGQSVLTNEIPQQTELNNAQQQFVQQSYGGFGGQQMQPSLNFQPIQQFPMMFQQIPQQFTQAPQQYMQQAPQQYMQAPMSYNKNINNMSQKFSSQSYGSEISNNSIRLINDKEQDKNKEVVAIIVTINSGGSYDHLFASVEQKSDEGTRVLVYEASSSYIQNLIKAYQGNPQDETSKQMMIHIGKLHPDCVVFNWECCGFYTGENFPQGKDNLFKFLKIILDKGHMAMFSDFSLKALIKDWKSDVLGPNPFVKTSQTSQPIEMKFIAGQLKQCPSAQLQIVGEMAEGGSCHINVMGGTICYSVNPDNLNHEFYKLKVLSVSTTTLPTQKKYECSIGQFKGSACHVLLTFPSGGLILTSMGHWIELMKIDTSDKKLFQVAEQNFGKQYAAQMKMEYANLDSNEQRAYVSSNAVRFVQNQAPCSNMSKKAKQFY